MPEDKLAVPGQRGDQNRGRGLRQKISPREYPDRPLVGVGGVVIEGGQALLIRRGSEPLRGQWSIPGGTLELGETLVEGVARELLEETGLQVRVLDVIEVFDRIYTDDGAGTKAAKNRPRFHYVIVDYLCERIRGRAVASSDVTDVAFAREEELGKYGLTETATRVLRKAFAMDRARREEKSPQSAQRSQRKKPGTTKNEKNQ
jgi:8-oxo-dGTP diphosphatase